MNSITEDGAKGMAPAAHLSLQGWSFVLIQGETEAGDKQDVGEEGRANISGRSNDWNG